MIKYISNVKKWGVKKTLLIIKISLIKKFFVFKENFLNKSKNEESYSQYAEDLFIDRLLNYPKNGQYVDIGANHPSYLNNTKRFYDRGWRGVNIEPDVNNFNLLENRRPNDTNLNAGVSNVEKLMTFYICEEDTLSTFSKPVAEELSKQGHKILAEKEVSVVKLSSILNELKNKQIDFMTIDTEGHDQEVLESNDWTKFRPVLICIEDNENSAYDSFFNSINYTKVGFNGLNSFFIDTL